MCAHTPRPLSSTLMRCPLEAGVRGGSPLPSPSLTCGIKIEGGMKVEKLLHYSPNVRIVNWRLGFISKAAGGVARRGEGESSACWKVFCKRRKLSSRGRLSGRRPAKNVGPTKAGLLNGINGFLKAPMVRLVVQTESVWNPCWESFRLVSNQLFIQIN